MVAGIKERKEHTVTLTNQLILTFSELVLVIL